MSQKPLTHTQRDRQTDRLKTIPAFTIAADKNYNFDYYIVTQSNLDKQVDKYEQINQFTPVTVSELIVTHYHQFNTPSRQQ